MGKGQSPIDALLGGEMEDIVGKKLNPNTGKQDEAAEKVSQEGGTAKMPPLRAPFTVR